MATQSERPRDPFRWCVGGLLAARGGWEVNGGEEENFNF